MTLCETVKGPDLCEPVLESFPKYRVSNWEPLCLELSEPDSLAKHVSGATTRDRSAYLAVFPLRFRLAAS